MLRSVTLGLALSVLVMACALVEPPVPFGTRPFQAHVRNPRPVPAELSITTADGVLEGAVQWPASVAAFSEANLTFHVPTQGAWEFAVNGDAQLGWEELTPNIGVCSLEFVMGDGDSTFSCLKSP